MIGRDKYDNKMKEYTYVQSGYKQTSLQSYVSQRMMFKNKSITLSADLFEDRYIYCQHTYYYYDWITILDDYHCKEYKREEYIENNWYIEPGTELKVLNPFIDKPFNEWDFLERCKLGKILKCIDKEGNERLLKLPACWIESYKYEELMYYIENPNTKIPFRSEKEKQETKEFLNKHPLLKILNCVLLFLVPHTAYSKSLLIAGIIVAIVGSVFNDAYLLWIWLLVVYGLINISTYK